MIFESICRTSTSLLLTLISFAQPANAENVKVVSMVMGEGLQLSDQTGFYAEVFKEILPQANVQSDFSVLPFRRALRDFFSKEADCIWAMDANLLRKFAEEEVSLVESLSVLTAKQYLFTKPGNPKIATMGDSGDKSIGILNGSNLLEIFGQTEPQFVTLPSQEAKIRMLMADRVDAIGAWTPDIYIALAGLGIDQYQVEPSLLISQSGVRVVCHESPLNLAFIDAVNAAIATLLESESYQVILDGYSVPQDFK